MFDPSRHTIRVQGGREYLPVAARLVWFREEHPDWGIVTDPMQIDQDQQYAIFRASIVNEAGRLIATATKREAVRGFPDYLEKAETGSVGRALALCGYGTQFAAELDEGERLADAPRSTSAPARNGMATAQRAGATVAPSDMSQSLTDPAQIAASSQRAEATRAARQRWIDAAGEVGVDAPSERGLMLNALLSRPLDSREAVRAADYDAATDRLLAEGVPEAMARPATEPDEAGMATEAETEPAETPPVRDDILADPFAEDEAPGVMERGAPVAGALFPDGAGRGAPKSAMAAGL